MAENSFFSYVSGTAPDGTEYAHRTSVQMWTVPHNGRKLQIYVQGPLPDGQYNAFAKKHLMTTTGGSHDGSPKGKLSAISGKRRTDVLAYTNQARQDKLDEMMQFAPAHAVQYNAANAYGANGIGFGTPLTMIHCDAEGMTPHKLQIGFATAIDAIGAKHWHSQGNPPHIVAHTNLRFRENIIYTQLYNKNDITTTNRMCVMVMQDRAINTYHVFHGGPYDPKQPNAGA